MKRNLAPWWLFAILIASIATVTAANADEFRVRSGDTVTVYSGELVGILPAAPHPARITFNADKVKILPVRPTAVLASRYPIFWTVELAVEGEQVRTLNCRGDVPAYIGLTFALDAVCGE